MGQGLGGVNSAPLIFCVAGRSCYVGIMVMRGERQPQGNDWRKATVGSAAAKRSHRRLWCEGCRHALTVSAEDLIELYGVLPEMPFWTPAQKLVCGACGSHQVGIMAASWDRARDHPDNQGIDYRTTANTTRCSFKAMSKYIT